MSYFNCTSNCHKSIPARRRPFTMRDFLLVFVVPPIFLFGLAVCVALLAGMVFILQALSH